MDTFRNKALLNDYQFSIHSPASNTSQQAVTFSPLVFVQNFFVAQDPEKSKVSLWPVICLGLVTGWSGQFFYWSTGMYSAGFWLFLTSFLFISSGLLCLMLSLAEVNSCLPFSGGSYGFSRITSDALVAFVAGVCDRINLTAGFLRMIYLLSVVILRNFSISVYYEILLWFVLCTAVLVFYLTRKKYMWHYLQIMILLIICLLIIVISCLATESNLTKYLPNHYDRAATNPAGSIGSDAVYYTFTDCIPLIFSFYHGMETIPFSANDIHEARKNLPKAIMITFITLFCSGIILLCLMASITSTLRSDATHSNFRHDVLPNIFIFFRPLQHALQVPDYVINLFYLIPCLGALLGFYYASNKLLIAMADSRLYLIGVIQHFKRFDPSNLGYYVTVITAFLAAVTLVFMIKDIYWITYELSLYCFIIAQLCNLSSFITFRRKYNSLHREFVSPVGIPGAVYAIFVLLVMLVATLMRGQNRVVVLPFMVILTLIFYAIYRRVRRFQIFSREEETILFLAHVMKANMTRKHKLFTPRPSTKGVMDLSHRSSSSKTRVTQPRSSVGVGGAGNRTIRSTSTNHSNSQVYEDHNKSFHSVASSSRSPQHSLLDRGEGGGSSSNGGGSSSSRDDAIPKRLGLYIGSESHDSTGGGTNNGINNNQGIGIRSSIFSTLPESIPEEEDHTQLLDNMSRDPYQFTPIPATTPVRSSLVRGFSTVPSDDTMLSPTPTEPQLTAAGEEKKTDGEDSLLHQRAGGLVLPQPILIPSSNPSFSSYISPAGSNSRLNSDTMMGLDSPRTNLTNSLPHPNFSEFFAPLPEGEQEEEEELFNAILDEPELNTPLSPVYSEKPLPPVSTAFPAFHFVKGILSSFSRSRDPGGGGPASPRGNRNNSRSLLRSSFQVVRNSFSEAGSVGSSTNLGKSAKVVPVNTKTASNTTTTIVDLADLERQRSYATKESLDEMDNNNNNRQSSAGSLFERTNRNIEQAQKEVANYEKADIEEQDLVNVKNFSERDLEAQQSLLSNFAAYLKPTTGGSQTSSNPNLDPNSTSSRSKGSNPSSASRPQRKARFPRLPRMSGGSGGGGSGNSPGNSINFSYIFEKIANSSSFDDPTTSSDLTNINPTGSTKAGNPSSNPASNLTENEYIQRLSDRFAARQVVLNSYMNFKRSQSRDVGNSSVSHVPSASSMDMVNGLVTPNRYAVAGTTTTQSGIPTRVPMTITDQQLPPRSASQKSSENYLIPENGFSSPIPQKDSHRNLNRSHSSDSEEGGVGGVGNRSRAAGGRHRVLYLDQSATINELEGRDGGSSSNRISNINGSNSSNNSGMIRKNSHSSLDNEK